jgi:hypothetical protein
MPNRDTFSIPVIGRWVQGYLSASSVSVDPFARNKRWATHTNDLNPATESEHHMDATAFMAMLADNGVRADLVIIDPPYSPRQVKECYDGIGLKMKQEDALRGFYHKKLKQQIQRILTEDGVVLTFGWNSTGMGKTLGFEITELMLVCHGSDHNDTICLAEKRAEKSSEPDLFEPSDLVEASK